MKEGNFTQKYYISLCKQKFCIRILYNLYYEGYSSSHLFLLAWGKANKNHILPIQYVDYDLRYTNNKTTFLYILKLNYINLLSQLADKKLYSLLISLMKSFNLKNDIAHTQCYNRTCKEHIAHILAPPHTHAHNWYFALY